MSRDALVSRPAWRALAEHHAKIGAAHLLVMLFQRLPRWPVS